MIERHLVQHQWPIEPDRVGQTIKNARGVAEREDRIGIPQTHGRARHQRERDGVLLRPGYLDRGTPGRYLGIHACRGLDHGRRQCGDE
jgi:hypothetical protein